MPVPTPTPPHPTDASLKPACKSLVLDAGPLLSLSPLRGLAEHFLTVPQVLSELKDKNAREHFERLGMVTGVRIEVKEPDAASLVKVIQMAKKTGDYAVLSHADLCVLALTLSLQSKEEAASVVDVDLDGPAESSAKAETQAPKADENDVAAQLVPPSTADDGDAPAVAHEPIELLEKLSLHDNEVEGEREPLTVSLEPVEVEENRNPPAASDSTASQAEDYDAPIFDDPSDEDDGEGEWITPDNVDVHKSAALDLFPSSDSRNTFTTVTGKKGRRKVSKQHDDMKSAANKPREQIKVGCMTADFAMQNVLLQMDLNLVGLEGKRIDKVKTWVLRCHACFKLCKDSSKKFCPSCGNPTLLRTSVTIKSPTASDSSPAMELHLKKNFVYRTRGTVYSIPAPKSGSSKTGSGEGLILREDQREYMRAMKHDEMKREKEEKRLVKQAIETQKGGETTGIKLGNWMDPDWVPEMLSVGIGGKGRKAPDGRVPLGADGMPVIGYGRKNPNERRRKR